MKKTEIQKQTLDLAAFLYFDLPFWTRWRIRRKFLQGTVTPKEWKDCLRIAYYMLRDGRNISYVKDVEVDGDGT